MCFLLAITACFDALSVLDSFSDNYQCSTEVQCDFTLFLAVSVVGMACSIVVYFSQFEMQNFRKSIAIDGL